MRYVIVLLALAGVVVSALALRVHYDTGTEPCSINEKWDCGIVNHSPFAEVEVWCLLYCVISQGFIALLTLVTLIKLN
jgi:hypothetical protein